MKRPALLIGLIALVLFLSCTLFARANSSSYRSKEPVAAAYVRLKMVHIVDKTGFSAPTEVLSLLIPSDWKFEGQITWHPENKSCLDPNSISSITYRVSSSDGLLSLQRFPTSFWMWTTNTNSADSPCPTHEPVSAVFYIKEQLLPQVRSNAQIISAQSLPEMSRITTEIAERNNAAAINFGQQVTAKADCARVIYEYSLEGHSVQESILGTIVTMSTRRPIVVYDKKSASKSSTKYADSFTIHASDFYASRAPVEQLESSDIVFARILLSARINPLWIAGRKEIVTHLKDSGDDSEGPLPQGKLIVMSEREIVEAYRRQAEARLPNARQFDPAVVPLETFLDTKTNQSVELNGGFDFAWFNNNDEYILTKDPNFNPALELKEPWTQLKHLTTIR